MVMQVRYESSWEKNMEHTLKRLLNTELEAEKLVTQAKAERDQCIQQALQEAHQAEQKLKAILPELHASFIKKAEARATQNIAELDKRYEEKKNHLRELATENQQKAVEAAIRLLMQVGKD